MVVDFGDALVGGVIDDVLSVEFKQPFVGVIGNQEFPIEFIHALVSGVGVNIIAIHFQHPLVSGVGGNIALGLGTITCKQEQGGEQCFHVLVLISIKVKRIWEIFVFMEGYFIVKYISLIRKLSE